MGAYDPGAQPEDLRGPCGLSQTLQEIAIINTNSTAAGKFGTSGFRAVGPESGGSPVMDGNRAHRGHGPAGARGPGGCLSFFLSDFTGCRLLGRFLVTPDDLEGQGDT